MMQRAANENAACLRRICKRSDQSKIERLENNDARLILRRKLTGQRHDRVQTERQELQAWTAISTLLGHRADETQQGRNSCPRLQFLAFSLDSVMSLSC